MKRILTALVLATPLMLAFPGFAQAEPTRPAAPQTAAMEETDPLDQARDHGNAAVAAGEKGDTAGLAHHAQAALERVRQAQAQKPHPDLDRAIQNLEETIRQARGGDANKATEHAKAAVNNLDAAKGAMGG